MARPTTPVVLWLVLVLFTYCVSCEEKQTKAKDDLVASETSKVAVQREKEQLKPAATYGHAAYQEVREEVHQPMPYKFGYEIDDPYNGQQHRHEVNDESGVVRGSYGYQKPDGQYRVVDYIADKDGFRAQIRTNEHGIANQDPADVKIEKEPGPEPEPPAPRDEKLVQVVKKPVVVQQHVATPVHILGGIQPAKVVYAGPPQAAIPPPPPAHQPVQPVVTKVALPPPEPVIVSHPAPPPPPPPKPLALVQPVSIHSLPPAPQVIVPQNPPPVVLLKEEQLVEERDEKYEGGGGYQGGGNIQGGGYVQQDGGSYGQGIESGAGYSQGQAGGYADGGQGQAGIVQHDQKQIVTFANGNAGEGYQQQAGGFVQGGEGYEKEQGGGYVVEVGGAGQQEQGGGYAQGGGGYSQGGGGEQLEQGKVFAQGGTGYQQEQIGGYGQGVGGGYQEQYGVTYVEDGGGSQAGGYAQGGGGYQEGPVAGFVADGGQTYIQDQGAKGGIGYNQVKFDAGDAFAKAGILQGKSAYSGGQAGSYGGGAAYGSGAGKGGGVAYSKGRGDIFSKGAIAEYGRGSGSFLSDGGGYGRGQGAYGQSEGYSQGAAIYESDIIGAKYSSPFAPAALAAPLPLPFGPRVNFPIHHVSYLPHYQPEPVYNQLPVLAAPHEISSSPIIKDLPLSPETVVFLNNNKQIPILKLQEHVSRPGGRLLLPKPDRRPLPPRPPQKPRPLPPPPPPPAEGPSYGQHSSRRGDLLIKSRADDIQEKFSKLVLPAVPVQFDGKEIRSSQKSKDYTPVIVAQAIAKASGTGRTDTKQSRYGDDSSGLSVAQAIVKIPLSALLNSHGIRIKENGGPGKVVPLKVLRLVQRPDGTSYWEDC